MVPCHTPNHLVKTRQSATLLLKLLRKESSSTLLQILDFSLNLWPDTISSKSSMECHLFTHKESTIETWKLRIVSWIATTILRSVTMDLLLLLKKKLIPMVFSKLYSEHQGIWLLKFFLNKGIMVAKLISSLLESSFSSWFLDILHLLKLLQKIPTTKL